VFFCHSLYSLFFSVVGGPGYGARLLVLGRLSVYVEMWDHMIKKKYIDSLQEGERFDDLFLVKSAILGETRAGKPYLVLSVLDKSGEISGPVWEDAVRNKSLCTPGEVVRVVGVVQSYREKPQLKIDEIEKIDQSKIDLSEFLPSSGKCRDAMADDLQKIILTVKNPFFKKLLNHFFKKDIWWPRFQEAPAAKGIHHAYIGGLLEHSLSVAQIAVLLANHYEGVDHSLLVAGALLHDIGKLEELTFEAGLVQYTVRGRLKGHLVMGSEMVAVAAGLIKNFPEDLLEQLQHLILSHHGRQEFGSPTVPMTVEALILSFIDDLDAKMNITEQLRRKMQSTELSWTEYQRMLERYLYLGGFSKNRDGKDGGKEKVSGRQPSLF